MTTTNFSRVLRGVKDKQIIIPILRAALSDPDFTAFTVPVRGWTNRPFDGWFHPSTHASWTARQLTYYLRHGDEIEGEKPTLTYVAAVTQGSFWHTLNQRILLRSGVLRRNPGTTDKDLIEKQCEIALKDERHNRRGHADGRMAYVDDELFEFKTANERAIQKYTSQETLKELNPFGYYSQCQDYLDISGFPKMRYLLMSLASPFLMKEFVVYADPPFQKAQRAKYREAIDAAREGYLPEACCGIASTMAKKCVTRDLCPIGRIS